MRSSSSFSQCIFVLLLAAGLAGCVADGPVEEPPITEPDEPSLAFWYLHHVGDCDGSAEAIMNQTLIEPAYQYCSYEQGGERSGDGPVEVFTSTEPWIGLSKGSLVQGRFYFVAEAPNLDVVETTYRLIVDGEVVAEETGQKQQLVPQILTNPKETDWHDWLNMTILKDIPDGAHPSLEFWVDGAEVYSIDYRSPPYLCTVPRDLPDFDEHYQNFFRDCDP